MPKLLHSVIVQNQDPSADGVFVHDLGVNPLSVLLLCLRPLNETDDLTDFDSYLDLCAAVNRLTILHQGAAVVSARGEDLAALAYFRHGIQPLQNNHNATNDERRCCTLPIILGRFPYDPTSCFPAVKRGELTLELDLDIAQAGYDDLQYTVEAIEILDAKPKEYERTVQRGLTFAATGDQDVDLPLGNVLRGCLLFGTTAFTGASPAPSWGRVKLLVDNQEHSYGSTDFEVLHTVTALLGRQPPVYGGHVHLLNEATPNTQDGDPGQVGQDGFQNYAWMELDPTRDDMFSVDLSGASEARLQSNAETADAIRVITVERIKV